MSTLVLGIDPGVTGAVAALLDDKVHVVDAPTFIRKGSTKRRFDIAVASMLLRDWVMGARRSGAAVGAYIELAVAVPGLDSAGERTNKMGAASAFAYGEGFGAWQGALAALEVPTKRVTPRKWKADLGLDSDKRKSLRLAIALYPQLATLLSLMKHNGRAEAVLLAHYGRTLLGLGQQPQPPADAGADVEF